jgi:hypothetical protein
MPAPKNHVDHQDKQGPVEGSSHQRIVGGARSHFFAHGFRGVTMDDPGHHVFDHCAKPASGDANGLLCLSALHSAFRVSLSLPGHAGLGAGHRRSYAFDAFHEDRPWHPAQGERPLGLSMRKF